MRLGTANRLLLELIQQHARPVISLHVLGEPTIHPAFFEILDFALSLGARISLTTNGASLGGPVGEALLSRGLWQLDISVQTPTARSFELRRSSGITFADYSRNILRFFGEYRRKHPGVPVIFRFLNGTICHPRLRDRASWVNMLCHGEEFRDALIIWAESVWKAVGEPPSEREAVLARIQSYPMELWWKFDVHRRVFFNTYFPHDWIDVSKRNDLSGRLRGACIYRHDHIAVLSNGDVVLCSLDFNGRTKMGNVNDATLGHILSAPLARDMLEGFGRGRLVHPYCQKCYASFRELCAMLAIPDLTPERLFAYLYRQDFGFSEGEYRFDPM